MFFQVDGLRAGYRDGPDIVRGASLAVAPGEVVCLVGPNGAGKSTTLKALFGLVEVRGGAVAFEGAPIAGEPPAALMRRGIAFIPQGRTVFTDMTVEENLEMGGTLVPGAAERCRRMEAVYDLFPVLRERRHDPAGRLSGGEQQMVAIGRGLMTRPRLLLLDEPTLGLAPRVATELFRAVHRIQEGGTAVLMVEQKVREALQASDRAYLMSLGEVRAEGPSRRILESPDLHDLYLGGAT